MRRFVMVLVCLSALLYCNIVHATPREDCLRDCDLGWAECTLIAGSAYSIALAACAFSGPAYLTCAGIATSVYAAAQVGCEISATVCKVRCPPE